MPFFAVIIILFAISGVEAQTLEYTVQKGDTLYSISKKYNIKITSLKSLNDIDDPSKLYPGMKIMIPGGYTVKKGDTLYSIAKNYDITVGELIKLNSLDKDAVIKQGQFLHVPADATPASVINKSSSSSSARSGKDLYWPHGGTRTSLTGKLRGIQIEGSPGDEIVSVAGGTVVWASNYGLYKKLILIESRSGIVYGYGGNEITSVKVGDSVSPGSIIGKLGKSSDKLKVYFFVYKDGKPLDPAKAPRV